jgi:hypothetical protein
MSAFVTGAMEQALRMRIRSILLSDAAQRLDFYVDHIHVDGNGLGYIALALVELPDRHRGVSVQIGGDLPADADAAFDIGTNSLIVPTANYGETPTPRWRRLFERMSIVHECIHAWRASMGTWMPTADGPWPTWGVSGEAAAFIGGALFFLDDQGPISASDTTPPWARGANPFSHALSLALSIRQSGSKGCNVNEFSPTCLWALKNEIIRYYRSHHLHLGSIERYRNELHM